MLNHARALLSRGWQVTLVGYVENALPPDLELNQSLHVWDLKPYAAGKLRLWLRLARGLRADSRWILAIVQTPPGFPVLWALPWRRGRREIVLDWHNLGASLYALKRPTAVLRSKLYGLCDYLAAVRATRVWAVSSALAARVDSSATVIADAPSAVFCSAASAPENRLEWWRRVIPDQPPPPAEAAWVVMPSSWGVDEEHELILQTARFWSAHAGEWGVGIRPVVVIATGRGPGRDAFEREMGSLPSGPVSVRVAWLPPEQYPVILAAADAGLCLHRSSSGLDLPMKLADMRGAGLPAIVLDYGAVLQELPPDSDRCRFFKSREELGTLVHELAAHGRGRSGVIVDCETWENRWNRILGPWCALLESKGGGR